MSPSLEQLGIDRLSADDRIELIGAIWDSLSDPVTEDAIPDWHRDELKRRLADAQADADPGIPWEVVQRRLRDRP
jgi:putative addiction module component (TIGR02574 family)